MDAKVKFGQGFNVKKDEYGVNSRLQKRNKYNVKEKVQKGRRRQQHEHLRYREDRVSESENYTTLRIYHQRRGAQCALKDVGL